MTFEVMRNKMTVGRGFVAALDQSGGSSPKALKEYGFPEDAYEKDETSMFDAIHEMRSRIITSPAFDNRVLGVILFEDTMERQIGGKATSDYLWEEKGIVPFLKIDKGLEKEENGVQLMKPIPNLDELLKRAKDKHHIFGTKMRSVIHSANTEGIKAIVDQQFELGKQILAAGLIPILEPEVDIHASDKKECEIILKENILDHLNRLIPPDQVIILKLTLPHQDNFYKECLDHPRCIRIVALSGGYSREEANEKLAKQDGVIASFSRALLETLRHGMSEEEFDKTLDDTIEGIYQASTDTVV